jgi:hypothetical protein
MEPNPIIITSQSNCSGSKNNKQDTILNDLLAVSHSTTQNSTEQQSTPLTSKSHTV